MKEAQIKKVETLTKDLGDLIKEVDPVKPAEWEAVEKLTAAHKQLRSIELADLSDNIHE